MTKTKPQVIPTSKVDLEFPDDPEFLKEFQKLIKDKYSVRVIDHKDTREETWRLDRHK